MYFCHGEKTGIVDDLGWPIDKYTIIYAQLQIYNVTMWRLQRINNIVRGIFFGHAGHILRAQDSYRSRLAVWFHSIYDLRARGRGFLSGIAARSIHLSPSTSVNLSIARESQSNWFNTRWINSQPEIFSRATLPPRDTSPAINNRRFGVASGIRCVSGRVPSGELQVSGVDRMKRAVTLTNDTSGTAREMDERAKVRRRKTLRANKMSAIYRDH